MKNVTCPETAPETLTADEKWKRAEIHRAVIISEEEKKVPGSVRFYPMSIDDYEEVYRLWKQIRGFGIRSIDDSRAGVDRFLWRNPGLSVVAENERGEIVGAILCGEDGRTGCLYHVCVRSDYRKEGIGSAMVARCMYALKERGINKISLIAFTDNDIGNAFWNRIGWTKRSDVNSYDFILNDENITRFVGK